MPRSADFTAAITACRSSRFLLDTRTASPWVWLETPFGPFSLISLLISRALSEEMPTVIVAVWRTVECDASSTSPYSRPFSDTLRRTSFSSSTWRRAVRRSSLTERRVSTSSCCSMDESVPLKSKRVPISRCA